MADVPLTQALIIVAQNYAGDVVRQINRASVALALFAPTFEAGEGPNAAWVAEGSGQVAEAFAEGADPTNFGSDSQTAASQPWARYWAPWHVTGTALAVAATSRTPAGNVRMWARQMVNASEALAKLINTDIYTGAGGISGDNKSLVGLDLAIGTANNTYALIDRTVGANAFWIPSVFNAAGPAAALTFATIRADQAAIKLASGYKPDVALVSQNTFNKIAALFDPQKFYVVQTNAVPTASQTITLDGGVDALKFDGTTFIADVFCPDGAIYYLNSRYVSIQYLPAELSMAVFPSDEAQALGGLTDGFETIPLGIVMELLAKTGDSQKAFLKCYPQLVVTRPNACGKRLNIA
ncbi:MAG: hypothetical protein JWN36_2399 [Microbacteriaceae bacterium]|nr:hypothetical protein [Microbacteriaceae bacterium]